MVRDGVWNSMSAEQEQIVALSVTIDKIKNDNLRLSKQLTSPHKLIPSSNNKSLNTPSSNKQNKNTSKDKGKHPSFKTQQNKRYAWKKKKPSENDQKKTTGSLIISLRKMIKHTTGVNGMKPGSCTYRR